MVFANNPQEQSLALGDMVVLDLTDEKGMYMGKMLADMGGRVIVVEPAGGHPARDIGPFYQDVPNSNNSLLFWYNNTNKESVNTSKKHQYNRQHSTSSF